MKVLKFGGTSVGSTSSINNVKHIIEEAAKEGDVVVVVSALNGVTDKLIATAHTAGRGEKAWEQGYNEIVTRHHTFIDDMTITPEARTKLLNTVDTLLEQLRSILFGVYLIHDLSEKTRDAIISYGERISSHIVATLCEGAVRMNARDFIRTERKDGKQLLATELTYELVRKAFNPLPHISVVPGFICRDKDTHETTNLGRGGSDYTASIIAAALDADILEIWTDVDGFMTADPRVINTAYTINELSYTEAMELCNFGAKVIYPPTIYPVCVKDIPIKVKNTFNPSAAGTTIKKEVENNNKPIRGISSIGGTSLIHVTGLSMVGVIGVNRRIFTTLADNGISVFMVSQASSENSTSIAVLRKDAQEAARVLNNEFAKEIETGAMFPMTIINGLATIAIVGENMRHTPGCAGKLFGTLGRSGISVVTCAQGASETNISFIVNEKDLRKSLNVIHDSFFLSEYKVLNLFICGVGTVGGKLIEQIKEQYLKLKEQSRLELNVVGIASSKHAIFNRDGINLDNYKEQLAASEPNSNAEKLCEGILSMNIFNSVFVDCTASEEISSLYQTLLEHNINVIAANKIAASSSYEDYQTLKQTAVSRGVKFRFETNVAAGLPVINTINDLRNSGDKILKIEAVLSGTLNYIFNELSTDVPFSETVRKAKDEGYSEPDPRADLSGLDVVRKLVILTREAGYEIEQKDVEREMLLPEDYFNGSVETFWKRLPELNGQFEKQRQDAEKQGKRWRFIGTMENGKARVSLKSVDSNSPFYNLAGSNNIVSLTTERYREYPMLIQGYGAGANVTAAGVFANIMSIANI